jgi:hypothetical protein
MLGIILIVIGIISIILGLAYFAKKAFWVLMGVVLLIAGAYFLFFTAAPSTNVDDLGNGIPIGVGPNPADFKPPVNATTVVSLHGFVTGYYDCGFNKTCIDVLDEKGKKVLIKTELKIDLEGVMDINAIGHFENSTSFVADNIIPTTVPK